MPNTTRVFLLILFMSFSSQAGELNFGGVRMVSAGDNPPALSVDEWLKGDSVGSFEKGTVYLVDFWGTWCPPCIKNIPHLTRLQKEYKDDGLIVISIATHEWDGIEPVKKFLKVRGDEMGYRIAFDGDQSIEHDWDTGGQEGLTFFLPRAFVIDKSGTVVWVGHPDKKEMEEAIINSIAAKWPHE